jgi:hypothetical protein
MPELLPFSAKKIKQKNSTVDLWGKATYSDKFDLSCHILG